MSSSLISLTCEPFRAWNRLEVRPRKKEFDRVLRAEIHDPLWMLTRQWQFGEFKGEDTGSAVFAKVKLETSAIARFQNHFGVISGYDNTVPLEASVEKMPVQYDLRFRARAAQHWLKMMKAAGEAYNAGLPLADPDLWSYNDYRSLFASVYTFTLPEIDTSTDTTAEIITKSRLLANKQAHQSITALSGRTSDGVAWRDALNALGTPPTDLPAEVKNHSAYKSAHLTFLLATAVEFLDWFKSTHEVPLDANDSSWADTNLEYRFRCSLPNTENIANTVIEAEEYYHGHLDWYAFNHTLDTTNNSSIFQPGSAERTANTATEILTLIPSEARFGGMPNSRWWQFEDGYTDLGNITAETTNVAKILLAEFALMYSNDWFVVPYVVPSGSLSEVKGIIVTDTFGVRTLVEAAGQGDSNDWTSWTMFNLSRNSASEELTGKVDPRIFIPPAAAKVQESKPLEAVEMVRDEMANMVWGVETIVPDLLGGGQSGHTAAQEFSNYLRAIERKENSEEEDTEETADEVPDGVLLRYNIGSTVPENWIPFLPTHLTDDQRAIKLQRASMPRWFHDEFSAVRPQTSILRPGMNNAAGDAALPFTNALNETQNTPYFIYEEEVPRAGVLIESTWQRTRWYNGKIVCWYGRRKESGRGEGSSGLEFDQVRNVEFENQEALVPSE